MRIKESVTMIRKHNIEIISIHIPKTGGTSLRNTLKDEYGDENAVRLDIKGDDIVIENRVFLGEKLSKNIKVVHGHFSFKEMTNHLKLSRKTKTICWFRDPVERVLSNYFYLRSQLYSKFEENHDNVNMLNRMTRSLEEFVELGANRNRMSKIISKDELQELTFIGFTETYAEDLEKLANLLGWSNYKEFKHNKTPEKQNVTKKIIERIKLLNKDDMELYEEALNIKKQRS